MQCCIKKVYISFIIILSIPSFAQDFPYRCFLESGILAGTNGRLPFWMLSNQYGRFSPRSLNSYIDGGFFLDSVNIGKSKFKLNGGLEGFLKWDRTWKSWVQQGYAGIDWGKLSAYIGNKEEHFGSQDPALSSGFVLWSGNARPFPKVSIGLTEWAEVPFTKNFVHFKGGLAHGWFGNDGYVKHVYFHHKYFYLRIGGAKKYHLNLGFHHIALWGGISPELGELPSSLEAYLKVFFAAMNDSSNQRLPWTERHNRIGNHLGTRDISFDYKFPGGEKLLLYWQNFIEDITGMGFRNIMDGLWGIHIILKERINVIYEFTNTVTDPSLPIINGYIWGLDDYFNNRIYKTYTYKGYTIGTPYITSPILFVDKDYPYNIENNRVRVHYISMGFISKTSMVTFKYSYSKNYGGSHLLFNPARLQKSIYCSFEKYFANKTFLRFKIESAMDLGEFYGNDIGIGASIKYILH